MNRGEGRKLIFINIIYVLVLSFAVFPLLWNAQYNVPSADDWSYGRGAYQAIKTGAGFWTVLKISLENVVRHYTSWEGRFVNSFLASWQPGIWGEQYYGIVGWIMIGGLIFGELILFRVLFGTGDKSRRFLWIPVAVPTLTLQIMYTPNTVESFYWYTGAVNYTFIFALSMVFMACVLRLATDSLKGRRKALFGVVAAILAIAVGGDNYSTSLSMLTGIVVCWFWIFWTVGKKEGIKALRNTWYLAVLEGGSLAVCLLAPGNTARLEGNFGGAAEGSAVWAIAQSLLRSFTNMYSWMNVKLFIMLVLIAPFLIKSLRGRTYRFAYPGLFTLITFAVYATQITATLYVDGTTGGGRAAAILYYSYHVWLVLNEGYWLGWLMRRLGDRADKPVAAITRFVIVYCALCGTMLVILLWTGDLMELSGYRAYRDWRQGWARQYAEEWNGRFEVLHDERVSDVVFEPLSVCPETLTYTDLQDAHGYTWVNSACARYYEKNSITVLEKETDF